MKPRKYLNQVIIFYFTYLHIESTMNAFNPSSLSMNNLSPLSTCAFVQKKFLAMECPPLESDETDESIVPCVLDIYKEHDAPFHSFCKILHPKISSLCLES